MRREGTQSDAAVDVLGETLLSVVLIQGLLPVGRRELEDAALRPAGEQAEEVPQVALGLEAVELAAREQRDEGRVGLGPLLAAPTKSQFFRLCRAFHKRNYVESRIMRSRTAISH